jgi:hypothetical protein
VEQAHALIEHADRSVRFALNASFGCARAQTSDSQLETPGVTTVPAVHTQSLALRVRFTDATRQDFNHNRREMIFGYSRTGARRPGCTTNAPWF